MKHTAVLLLLCAFLMGCDAASNPFSAGINAGSDEDTVDGEGDGGDADGDDADAGDDATGGDGGSLVDSAIGIPEEIAGNVTRVTFDSEAGTLTVTGVNLDNVPTETEYTRNPGLDQNGFLAFTTQDDPLDRHFTAYVRESGSVRAAVVSSPFPRNRVFRGAYFERDGAYDPPDVTEDTGLVTYAGTYVGLTNIGDPNGSDLLSTTVDPAELQPGQALSTDGDVVLNADFADNSVEGNIFNRRLLDTNGNEITGLPSVVLIVTPIDSNGQFAGTVEYDVIDARSNTNDFVEIGTYAGIFGGEDSSEVAGGVDLTEFDGVDDPLGFTNELESGAFVLDACTAASSNPVCQQIP